MSTCVVFAACVVFVVSPVRRIHCDVMNCVFDIGSKIHAAPPTTNHTTPLSPIPLSFNSNTHTVTMEPNDTIQMSFIEKDFDEDTIDRLLLGAHGLMFVFDITQDHTFEYMAGCLPKLTHALTKLDCSLVRVAVGDSAHLSATHRTVEEDFARLLCASYDFMYYEVSHITGYNIEFVFVALAKQFLAGSVSLGAEGLTGVCEGCTWVMSR